MAREYTLYPGKITFPTAADAKSALIAERESYPSAYVVGPSGKRLKVAKRNPAGPVHLQNFTGTVTQKSDGRVIIRGRQKGRPR